MRITLKTKISVAVLGIVGLALVTSGVVVLSSRRLAELLDQTVHDHLPSMRAAEELEIALLEERGLVSAHMLEEGNPRWLAKLPATRQSFQEWFRQAQGVAHTAHEKQMLSELEQVYRKYDAKREEAVALYRKGQETEAKKLLLGDVQQLNDEAYRLCEAFIDSNIDYVAASTASATSQVSHMTRLSTLAAVVTLGFGCGLLWLFFAGVLLPLRRMIVDARQFTGQGDAGTQDELGAVGDYLRRLMSDVTETRSNLEESRIKLSGAEKLAAVGRLAASVAHEIRNPLAAIKMLLTSIRRSLAGDQEADRKFGIISDELARLENIVRHFLEFSRPPRLKLQQRDLRGVVQQTLELCSSRFEETCIHVDSQVDGTPLYAMVDAEQLRQVLLNLLNNAMDAAPQGGTIRVSVSEDSAAGGQRTAVVRVADTGTGMPAEVQQRVFEPFFTTKQQGTGLGLAIAAQIMARHEGRLVLESSNPQGTTFAMRIPAVQG